jgi:hypothetical protein
MVINNITFQAIEIIERTGLPAPLGRFVPVSQGARVEGKGNVSRKVH